MRARILLADDHKVMLEGLRALLEKQSDLEVVAEAGDGQTVVRLAQKLKPDVAIMDVTLPVLNGIEATRIITVLVPGIKVIGFSMHSGRRFVTEMLKAGAVAYVLKECAFEELVHAIRAVLAKRTYLSPKIADTVIKDYVGLFPTTEFSAFSILTSRERQVLQLLAEGTTTKNIASRLLVSTKTVETHRQRIMDKLNIYTIAELTKYAIREGVTSLET
jgi:DNA-binding NarL/FixJ family response regulator